VIPYWKAKAGGCLNPEFGVSSGKIEKPRLERKEGRKEGKKERKERKERKKEK
jgi:hypothetical protein